MAEKTIIAYIEQNFPSLTTTFIYREIFALEDRDIRVVTFSIHGPNREDVSEEVQHLIDTTHYIKETPRYKLIWAHLFFLFVSPLRYLSTVIFFMSRHYATWNERRRTMLHFLAGVHFALIARKEKIQHIHAHFAVLSTTISMIVARLLGITYSFTAHSSCFYERILLPEKIEGAQFIAAISNYTRDFLIEQARGKPGIGKKIHILHCGIPTNHFLPPSSSYQNDRITILSIGQLRECKGMAYLVNACHHLKKRKIDFRCLIIGDGQEYAHLAELISRFQLTEHVFLLGKVFQEKLLEYLQQADIFAMACIDVNIHLNSVYVDGIPVALMEAMATETPCVSTMLSGIPELIDHNVNGLLVEQKNDVAFADALQLLIEDQEVRQRMGKAAREKIISDFNIEATSAQMSDLITQQIRDRACS